MALESKTRKPTTQEDQDKEEKEEKVARDRIAAEKRKKKGKDEDEDEKDDEVEDEDEGDEDEDEDDEKKGDKMKKEFGKVKRECENKEGVGHLRRRGNTTSKIREALSATSTARLTPKVNCKKQRMAATMSKIFASTSTSSTFLFS